MSIVLASVNPACPSWKRTLVAPLPVPHWTVADSSLDDVTFFPITAVVGFEGVVVAPPAFTLNGTDSSRTWRELGWKPRQSRFVNPARQRKARKIEKSPVTWKLRGGPIFSQGQRRSSLNSVAVSLQLSTKDHTVWTLGPVSKYTAYGQSPRAGFTHVTASMFVPASYFADVMTLTQQKSSDADRCAVGGSAVA